VDWGKWHDLYESRPSLQERLVAVRAQVALAISAVAAEPVHVLSICAGDGRDLTGGLAGLASRKAIRATLIESSPELVARGRAAVDEAHLTEYVSFRCADATRSSTYHGIPPAHVVVLAGVFGNLKEADVRRLIESLRSLCRCGASVVWTRNLVEFDDGEKAVRIIRECFSNAAFREEYVTRSPSGVFAVGTHSYQGAWRPLPRDATLFEFTGCGDRASDPGAVV
jgi:hypothetical protein